MSNSRETVRQGHKTVAASYVTVRERFDSFQYLEQLSHLLPAGDSVLDVGCGTGIPIDTYLVGKGYKVTGIDFSEEMIALATRIVPEARYEVKDMTALKPSEHSVDAIVSFYAIFHTPRKGHENLFRVFNSFLRPGGCVLVTMGSDEWEGEEDFCGVRMWWSNYGAEQNREILAGAGFDLLLDTMDTSANEQHQVLMARKLS